jgi:hypothetical protein
VRVVCGEQMTEVFPENGLVSGDLSPIARGKGSVPRGQPEQHRRDTASGTWLAGASAAPRLSHAAVHGDTNEDPRPERFVLNCLRHGLKSGILLSCRNRSAAVLTMTARGHWRRIQMTEPTDLDPKRESELERLRALSQLPDAHLDNNFFYALDSLCTAVEAMNKTLSGHTLSRLC